MPYVNKPLKGKEEIIKIHIENIKHMSVDELERKLKEKVELIRLLEEEEYLRNEQKGVIR